MANLNCFASFGDDDRNPVREAVGGALENKVGALFSLLWDMSLGGMTNLLLLHRNARRLDDEMTRLEALRDDLRGRALSEAAARSQAEITRQVGGWLGRVADLRSKVDQFQADLERQSICIAGLCLAFGAADNLRQAQALARQGLGFGSVTGAADPGTDALLAEMDELTVSRNDLMRRVEAEEAADPQARRTNLVESWVRNVDSLLWSSDASSSSRTTAAVVEMLARVRNLKARGDDLQLGAAAVVSRLPPDSVQEVPSIPSSSVVGGEAALSEVRRHLEDEGAGIIGVYGMGGVGKTTLVKKLNNELLRPDSEGSGMFDVVALVTVSRRPNILSLQYGIGKRMGISFSTDFSGPHSTRQEGDQARVLFRALSRKRFLLLLDDVWKKLDLGAVGIPHPGGRKNCKIVFTTRSAEVCDDMDADRRVVVKPLDEAHSWRLFCSKMGANEAVDDEPSVRGLAVEVVKRCGGLPLALITVGRAMAGRKLPGEWRHAIQSLDDSATELRGMESVLSSLKFSFDELENDTLRSCLLYCALFHNEVPRNRLVEYWIGEGLLDGDGDGDINRARNRGHFIISRLRDACLLEPREMLIWGEAVGLHDAVLDMVLWLTGDRLGDSDVFLALAGRCEVPPIQHWGDAKRISLVENTTQVDFAAPPNCPNLSTLLLSSSRFGRSATGGFFSFMPLLRVLALSTTNIREVPGEIGLLVQLRFLDLSNTRIRALPEELGKLTRLRQLLLAYTFDLRRIPREAITGLTSLQQLDMYESDYQWDGDAEERSQQQQQQLLGLRDLEQLPRLRNLSITLFWDRSSRQVFTSSCWLLKSTTHLAIRLSQGFDAAKAGLVQIRHLFLAEEEGSCARGLQLGPGDLPSLLNLILLGFNYSSISVRVGPGGDLPLRSLQELRVDQCNLVEDLTWAGQLPCLRELEVNRCDSMGELLKVAGEVLEDEEYDAVSFPRLKTMILNELKSLTCISERILLLPLLEELKVRGCPELKRLPLGHRSAPKMAKISGEQEWWGGLTWDAPIGEGSSALSRFLPYLEIVVPPAEEGSGEWGDGEDEEPEMEDLDLLRDLLGEDELDWDDSEDEDEEDDPMDEDT